MLQTLAVILLVGTAVFLAVRRLVRTLRGKRGCSCGCDRCPMNGDTCRCHDHSPRLPDIEL